MESALNAQPWLKASTCSIRRICFRRLHFTRGHVPFTWTQRSSAHPNRANEKKKKRKIVPKRLLTVMCSLCGGRRRRRPARLLHLLFAMYTTPAAWVAHRSQRDWDWINSTKAKKSKSSNTNVEQLAALSSVNSLPRYGTLRLCALCIGMCPLRASRTQLSIRPCMCTCILCAHSLLCLAKSASEKYVNKVNEMNGAKKLATECAAPQHSSHTELPVIRCVCEATNMNYHQRRARRYGLVPSAGIEWFIQKTRYSRSAYTL